VSSSATPAFGPIARLWVSRRAGLAVLGSCTWALGFAWLAFVSRYNALSGGISDVEWQPLFSATLVLGLPATLGILAGETVHELFRHTSTMLLPGLRVRLRRSALRMAAVVTLVTAPTAVAISPELDWFAAVALSLTGFASGCYLLLRLNSTTLWVLRLGAYAVLLGTAPELALWLGSSVWLCLGLGTAAVLAIGRRFHTDMARASASSNIPTVFTAFGGQNPLRSAQHATPSIGKPCPTPQRTGGDLAGWQAARDFEQLSMAGSSLAPGRMTRHVMTTAFIAVLSAMGVSLVRDDLPAGGPLSQMITLLADVVVGLPGVMLKADKDVFRLLMLVLGVTTAVQAILAARPLAGGVLYPISRPMRAQLACSAGWRLARDVSLTTLMLGGALTGVLWFAAGSPPLDRAPHVVWMSALHLIVVPWSMLFFLASRRLAARGRQLLALICGTAMPGVLVFLLITTIEGLPGNLTPGNWAVGAVIYLGIVAASFAGLRRFTQWHFGLIDLTTR
jgi:hypothetical protein